MWYAIGLLIFAILIFALFTLLRRWADSFIIIAFAIGCIVNANLYNSFTMPIKVGPLVFGVDAILYILYIFAVVIKFIHYPVKDGKIVAVSSIFAIELSALIELSANLINLGNPDCTMTANDALIKFAVFTISAVGSVLATFGAAKLTKTLTRKKINTNLVITIAVSVGFLIHRIIFYSATILITPQEASFNYGWAFLSGIIELVICLGLCLLSYFISVNYFVPHEISKMILDNKTSIAIRMADEDDAQDLHDLVFETLQSRRVQMIYDESDQKILKDYYSVKHIKDIIKKRHVYLAINDGIVVASAAVEPYEGQKDIAYISFCYTSPKKQGKGLGRIILKAIENDEYSTSAKTFRLHALLTASKYFERAGFSHLNSEPTIINDQGVQSYVMIKNKEEAAK